MAGFMVLLTTPVGAECLSTIANPCVVYRPDLAEAPPVTLGQALETICPSILVTKVGLDAPTAGAWRAANPRAPLILVHEVGHAGDEVALTALGIDVWTLAPQREADQFAISGLRLAERAWMERATEWTDDALPRSSVRRVALVGAGIVNLMTALALVRDGHEVVVYDAESDPRGPRDDSIRSCTHGGDNARMFTLTEADNYGDTRFGPSQELNALLDLPVSAGGWRLVDERPLFQAEQRWLDEVGGAPQWLVHEYTDDILSFNREAGDLWSELRSQEPDIFDDVVLRDGIVRLYDDVDYLRAQVARQRHVGALRRVLDPAQLVERHPALATSSEAGIVGAIEVSGFTVAIHDLVARVLAALERRGVLIHFGSRVQALKWSRHEVIGLMTETELIEADDYVLSTGAYGNDLLEGTASHGQIHGVLGAWVTLPNLDPALGHSLKMTRRGHTAPDSNITVGRDRDGRPSIVVGSGYGWVGLDPLRIAPDELEVLFAGVEDTARRLFPLAFDAAKMAGTLANSRRTCVRPWTACSLGIFERLPAAGGGSAIVTGGHNTGGFAQAPVVALAVARAIRRRGHAMHALYHPNRHVLFNRPRAHA